MLDLKSITRLINDCVKINHGLPGMRRRPLAVCSGTRLLTDAFKQMSEILCEMWSPIAIRMRTA